MYTNPQNGNAVVAATPEQARLTGLRSLVLELVTTSDYTTAAEKATATATARVAACQSVEVLVKWYRNAVRELAEREENQPIVYATSPPNGGGNTLDEQLAAAVENGLLACFTLCKGQERHPHYVPRRVALRLLFILAEAEKLTDYQVGAVGAGHACRVEYQDCLQALVLGVYTTSAAKFFLRGLLGYLLKAARRTRKQRLELLRERDQLLLDSCWLGVAVENYTAETLYYGEGLAA